MKNKHSESQMNSEDQIIELIEDEMNFNWLNSNIGELRLRAARYIPTEYPTKYDEYTVLDFIILYKIEELFKNNIITKTQRDYLKKLYITKLEINEKTKQMIKDGTLDEDIFDSKAIRKASDITTIIHKELAKFDIISDNMVVEFLLKDIITKNIKGTNYTKLPTDEDLEKVLQKVKKISPVKLDEEKK